MISDEKRREVAERLRALPIDVYAAIEEWEVAGLFIDESIGDEADYSQIHGAVLGCFPAEHMHPIDYKELHERLADLIDRPTCRKLIPDEMEGYVFCSNCGAEIGEYGVPNYCPSCGAKVVDK